MTKPRKASKKWLVGAPDYVLACYDAGDKLADRYTVLLGGEYWEPSMGYRVQYLAMGDTPWHPQGFSQFDELLLLPGYDRRACGKQIAWLDLPRAVRDHAEARLNLEGME